MKLTTTLLLIGCVAIMLGCSSDPTSPTPEVGSGTLLVNAHVIGEDAGSGTFETQFEVDLADNTGTPVNDAVVTINHSAFGVKTLTWDTLQPGFYSASVSGYHSGVYTLNITRGTDSLQNARVVGPDIHTITYPTLNDTIPLSTSIVVTWSMMSIADQVEIETRDYGPTLSSDVGDSDDGDFVLPGSNTVRDDQYIRLTRSNMVSLSTGFTGSTFEASIRNTVEPLVVN